MTLPLSLPRCEATVYVVKRYNEKIDRENDEAAAKEGIFIGEWIVRQVEKKRKEVKEWYRQEGVMLGLKKLKKDKKKLIIIEETEPIIESYSLIVEPTGEEMAWMANIPKPNTKAEMVGMTDKPDPANKEMVVKAPMLEQKS